MKPHATEIWIDERPPERVLAEWREARARTGLEFPNNEPDRFFATCEATAGASPCVLRIAQDNDAPMFLIARLAKRRSEMRLGPVRLRGFHAMTADVVRGGVLADADQAAGAAEAGGGELFARGVKRISWHARRESDALTQRILANPLTHATAHDERYWLRIADDAATALAHRSSKTRSKLKRYARLLETKHDGDMQIEEITRPEQVADFCAACDAISKASYHDAIGYGVRDNEFWRSVLAAVAERNELRAFLLRAGGEPIAYQNGSVIADVYYSDGKGFNRGHSDDRPGTVLLVCMLDVLFADGVRAVDFGCGESDYKDVFTNCNEPEVRITSLRRGIAGRLSFAGASAAGWARSLAKSASSSAAGRKARAAWVRRQSHRRETAS